VAFFFSSFDFLWLFLLGNETPVLQYWTFLVYIMAHTAGLLSDFSFLITVQYSYNGQSGSYIYQSRYRSFYTH